MNLILKDFLLVKNKLLGYCVLCITIFLVFELTIHNVFKVSIYEALVENILVCLMGILFSYFNTIISFEAEGKYKAQATIVTLPYKRSNIIAAKYVGILLISLLFYSCSILVMAGLNFLKIGTLSGIGIIYGIACSFMIHAFMIPFFVRFEYTKAANVMMLLFMMIGVLTALFAKSMLDIDKALDIYKQIDDKKIMIFSVILLLISYIISTNMYEKKEFS